MSHETEGPGGPPATIDDDQLAALVRARVDDWRLPPQRLDQPTWRERVGARGTARRRGWLARLGRPAGVALVATVIVAFVAVWLTAPRATGPIAGASPTAAGASPSTAGATPGRSASPSPSASGLPVLQLNGAPPEPAGVMVQAGSTYRIVDLATGTLGDAIVRSHRGPTTMLARAAGGWACICGDWSATGQAVDRFDLTFEAVDAAGTKQAPVALRTIRGTSDPSLAISNQPMADVTVTGSADGRFAFIGWTARQGAAGWDLGVDVIDLADGDVVELQRLPVTEPAGAGGRPTIRIAPRVAAAPSGGALLVSSFWYVDDPSSNPPSGTDHWMSSFDGVRLGALKPAGATSGETCGEGVSGAIDATMHYILCTTPAGPLTVVRRTDDGAPIDVTDVPGTSSGFQESSLVVRVGDRLFIWDPVDRRLARFDLRTAAMDSATGTAQGPSGSPLDAVAALGRRIGNWLAPSTLAKVILQPALVASPDGTRIYALGVDAPVLEVGVASRGVYAFDADTLEPLGHWAPTADLASIAVSPDGRFVYAAGQAGIDADGNQAPWLRASLTVYNTADGSVRLIAGDLGPDGLFFPASTVH